MKIITNEITSQERTDLYAEGGCFFITSRIFIVDLLDRKVDASTVAGLLITNAHKYNFISDLLFIESISKRIAFF
jgi:DNA excision repair protein ERCC-4